jgi:dienelactone hydrolase
MKLITYQYTLNVNDKAFNVTEVMEGNEPLYARLLVLLEEPNNINRIADYFAERGYLVSVQQLIENLNFSEVDEDVATFVMESLATTEHNNIINGLLELLDIVKRK